jgi:hypothetical protein
VSALSSRLKAAIAAFVRRISSCYEYAGTWAYTVKAVNGDDDTVELAPDEPTKVPPLSRIPILWGSPAVKAKPTSGARCRVRFVNRDPSRPVVLGWEHGNYDSVQIGDGTVRKDLPPLNPVARCGDSVKAFLPPTALFTGTIGPLTVTGIPVRMAIAVFGQIDDGCSKSVKA